VQTNLDLTISEKGVINPTAELAPVTPADAVFTLGLGVSGSSEATRTNKVMSFNTVAELRALDRCDKELRGGPTSKRSEIE
jgi:hypothetical protein